MRPSNKSRSRNKPGNNGGHNQQRRNPMGNIINRVFESAGPDGKVRGTPQQIIDKYQALARDAQLSGDRVTAESYLQHSEHYSRLLGEAQRQQMETRREQDQGREDARPDREEGGAERPIDQQPRRPQQQAAPVMSSGLAMIDPEDSFDMSGPIETPEGRGSDLGAPSPAVESTSASPAPAFEAMPQPDLAPAAEPAPVAEAPVEAPAEPQAEAPAEAAEAAPERPKRRRRPRAQAPAATEEPAAPVAE